MEPVTINLEGLSEFGPFGYLFAYLTAAAVLGFISWRQMGAAGRRLAAGCKHFNDAKSVEQQQQTVMGKLHIARSAVSGVLGLGSLVVALCMSLGLYGRSFDKTRIPFRIQSTIGAPTIGVPPTMTASMASFEGAYGPTLAKWMADPEVRMKVLKTMDGLFGTPQWWGVTTGDGSSFIISTKAGLSLEKWTNLRTNAATVETLNSGNWYSAFLCRCHRNGIQVTGVQTGEGKVIWDSSDSLLHANRAHLIRQCQGGKTSRFCSVPDSENSGV